MDENGENFWSPNQSPERTGTKHCQGWLAFPSILLPIFYKALKHSVSVSSIVCAAKLSKVLRTSVDRGEMIYRSLAVVYAGQPDIDINFRIYSRFNFKTSNHHRASSFPLIPSLFVPYIFTSQTSRLCTTLAVNLVLLLRRKYCTPSKLKSSILLFVP